MSTLIVTHPALSIHAFNTLCLAILVFPVAAGALIALGAEIGKRGGL